ncbi:hypothetical protein X975_20739, partial [Stegodyphus mimosarum]
MMFYLKLGSLLMVTMVVISVTVTSSKSIGQQEKVLYPSEFDIENKPGILQRVQNSNQKLLEDDGSMDTALLNYLFA